VDEIWISVIVFVCVSGCALFGGYLRSVLPESYFSDQSVDVIKLATGLVSTMAALVLGLLISSAKGAFDTMNSEIVRSAASVVRLDRVMAKYGPETQGIRALLKSNFGATLTTLDSGDTSRLAMLKTAESVGSGEDV
jgi:spore maturation protein SpmA